MAVNKVAQRLHDKFTKGEMLTVAEKQLLDAWYAEQDKVEEQLLSKSPGQSMTEDLLRKAIDESHLQLAQLTHKLHSVESENDRIQMEIALMRKQLGKKLAQQAA